MEKLKEAKYLITELQEELKLLQPRLVETSANTEALMIKIEQDTIQVERKKEVWIECNASCVMDIVSPVLQII